MMSDNSNKREHTIVNKYEKLVLWYLRLNGYLTVSNFILHPSNPGPQKGEIDVLGVRFQYSHEKDMSNDDELICSAKHIDLVIGEVKRSKCGINKPWESDTNDSEYQKYILRWLGIIPEKEICSRLPHRSSCQATLRGDRQTCPNHSPTLGIFAAGGIQTQ